MQMNSLLFEIEDEDNNKDNHLYNNSKRKVRASSKKNKNMVMKENFNKQKREINLKEELIEERKKMKLKAWHRF